MTTGGKIVPAKRTNHRASWLARELTQVKRYLREGLSVGAIGKLLGRTEGAVRKKLFDEGISARRSRKPAAKAGKARGRKATSRKAPARKAAPRKAASRKRTTRR